MISERLQKLVEDMVDRGVQFDDAVREFERRFITLVIARSDGRLVKAAEALGMHRNTLSRKISEFKIKRHSG